MTIAAGLDIGNSTTEVVLGRIGRRGIEVIDAARAPTRRAKGSPESLDGAAALLRRLERSHQVQIEVACAAWLRPVETRTATLPEPETKTGRLTVLCAGAGTAGGTGHGVGRPFRLGEAVPQGLVVAVVPSGTGYAAAVEQLGPLIALGRLAAVLLEDDEAVLVANRLPVSVPVVDEVDPRAVLTASLVAVEVSEPGTPLRVLTDPLRLVESLRLDEADRADAARLAARLFDASNAVVGVRLACAEASRTDASWVELDGVRVPFPRASEAVRGGPVGHASSYCVPPDDRQVRVDDLWTVDLSAVADTVMTRAGGARSRAIGLAALHADAPYLDPAQALADRLGIPVEVEKSEARAGWAGAMTTPGAAAPADLDGTVVIDLGGGTLDTVSMSTAVVAAGGGELLTQSVAALTGATTAAAEWVKRGPAHRVEAPQILLAEDGSRKFLDRPAPAETIGALVVGGPAGLLPFSRILAPGEWRALRLRLKVELIGRNVTRALRTIDVDPTTVVVVGGPAGDDEVLSAVSRALPQGVAVGRGNVGGTLEHRYAVAYGLLSRLRC